FHRTFTHHIRWGEFQRNYGVGAHGRRTGYKLRSRHPESNDVILGERSRREQLPAAELHPGPDNRSVFHGTPPGCLHLRRWIPATGVREHEGTRCVDHEGGQGMVPDGPGSTTRRAIVSVRPLAGGWFDFHPGH